MKNREEEQTISNDPATSFWLKEQLEVTQKRDPIDALNDAEMTPFKRTINKAKTVLERGGEWHIDTLIKVINTELGGHHYCHDNSAKQCISKFLVELGVGEKVDNRPVYKLKSE